MCRPTTTSPPITCPHTLAPSHAVRGDPHVLVVGDPGLGKSQMLHAVAAIAPRSVYVVHTKSRQQRPRSAIASVHSEVLRFSRLASGFQPLTRLPFPCARPNGVVLLTGRTSAFSPITSPSPFSRVSSLFDNCLLFFVRVHGDDL